MLYEVAARFDYVIHDPFLQNIGSRELAKARCCRDYFLVPEERVSAMSRQLAPELPA